MSGALFFGDNLDVLREHVQTQSIDLVYLDPPFNSNATYNVLFKAPSGQKSEAQAEAFRDTWGWGDAAEQAYDDVMRGNGELALVLSGFRRWLGENAMMAYLSMMAARMAELHRVMKPTASLYLHCDPTASHYLKILLDAAFGGGSYANEIIWKRTSSKSDHSQGAKHWPRIHDTILFFRKSETACLFQQQFGPLEPEYVKKKYPYTDAQGRQYGLWDMTGPGGAAKGNPQYEVMGVTRYWRYSRDRMERLIADGRVIQPRPGAVPREKRYLDQSSGVAIGDVWPDIPPINSQARERLGYPTQKPLPLLERLIAASSKPGSTILDPFCGCGTSVEAAEKLGRHWIGIDVTHYAITLIERRLQHSYPAADYEVKGRPTDLAGARDLFRRDPHQFQWWAAWRLGAHTYREAKRGADRGIDGNIFFSNGPFGTGRIIISVKGGEHVGPVFTRELRGTIEREGAEMGILVTLAQPTRAMMADAAAAGFVSKSAHGRLPRLQVVTIDDLLSGHLPRLPALPPRRDSPVPRKRASKSQLEMLLPLATNQLPLAKGDFLDPALLEIGSR